MNVGCKIMFDNEQGAVFYSGSNVTGRVEFEIGDEAEVFKSEFSVKFYNGNHFRISLHFTTEICLIALGFGICRVGARFAGYIAPDANARIFSGDEEYLNIKFDLTTEEKGA